MDPVIGKPGDRFGKLVIVERAGSKRRMACWLCKCDCGGSRIAPGVDLRRGNVKSCGCLHYVPRIIKHGHCTNENGRKSKTYQKWADMKTRCYNKHAARFKSYGGRGIKVCDRWMDFANFLADMGECPPGKTIGRINNDGSYKPGNVRWEDDIVQHWNTQAQAKKKRRQDAYLAGKLKVSSELLHYWLKTDPDFKQRFDS